jgi:hypothetical protein
MDIKEFRKFEKKNSRDSRKEAAEARKIKTYKGEWYTVNSILGNDWARFFYLLGGR